MSIQRFITLTKFMKKNRILITGAAGFVGSHLTEKLLSLGYRINAFDRYNSKNDFHWLNDLRRENNKNCKFILGDIRDQDSVLNAMKDCDAVIHLAALIGIPYSYVSPLAYIKTNLEGTYNILEASKLLKLNNIIITSTSEVYGSAQYLPIDEMHPINSQSPYAASKVAADQLAMSYYRSFKLPIKIIRPFNIYGPRQSERAIIPTIINQALGTNDKIFLGNTNPTRDFNYISDVVDAFLKVMKNKRSIGHIINVGSNKKISIGHLTKEIFRLSKKNKKIKRNNLRKRPKSSEVDNLQCNNKKIKKLLSWHPKVELIEGLTKTIRWFKKNRSGNNKDYII